MYWYSSGIVNTSFVITLKLYLRKLSCCHNEDLIICFDRWFEYYVKILDRVLMTKPCAPVNIY